MTNVYARKGCVLHRHLVFWKVVLVILIMEKHCFNLHQSQPSVLVSYWLLELSLQQCVRFEFHHKFTVLRLFCIPGWTMQYYFAFQHGQCNTISHSTMDKQLFKLNVAIQFVMIQYLDYLNCTQVLYSVMQSIQWNPFKGHPRIKDTLLIRTNILVLRVSIVEMFCCSTHQHDTVSVTEST